MDRVGILIVSKCLSASAIADTLLRSEKYVPELFVIEKQLNPFNSERAEVHKVVPDLNLRDVVRAASRVKGRVSFALTDTEDFIIAGGRDALEKETGIQTICVTKKYALERSKADQRLLFDRTFREANPKFRIFDPRRSDVQSALAEFKKTVAEIGPPVIKPDRPTRGAGVGVWGSDFGTQREAADFFLKVFATGRVIVEEKVEGEESSFHAFSDGKHFIPAPLCRDYKRALDDDRGPLTGGMGSYRGPRHNLSFVSESEWESLSAAEERAFRRWKGRGSNPGLRGVVLYDAIMHTGRGFKVLERNSRGGNTEFINLLTTLTDDFIDVCFRILEGSLRGMKFGRKASVVTCAVPLTYGTKDPPTQGASVDLAAAYKLSRRTDGAVRVFPMDLRLERGKPRAGTSRTVAVVGVGDVIEEARRLSMKACASLVGPLRWRRDIASSSSIMKSRDHLSRLRR